MKRRLLIVALVLALALCFGILLVAQPTRSSRSDGDRRPTTRVLVPQPVVVAPDLVITAIELSGMMVPTPGGGSEPHKLGTLSVKVKNVGTKESDPCQVAVYILRDVRGDNPVRVAGRGSVPAIHPGSSSSVRVSEPGQWPVRAGVPLMLLAVVDVPVEDNAAGQVAESLTGELNNTFGVAIKSPPPEVPVKWENPAAG